MTTIARVDRLQQALHDAFVGVAPFVHWENDEVDHDDFAGSDFISLSHTSGPVPWLKTFGDGETLCPADSVIVRVDSAVADALYIVRLNAFSYIHQAAAGESVTDIRDALSALIAAGEAGYVTPSDDGTDGILLTADFFGGLRRLDLRQAATLMSSESAVYSGDAVLEAHSTDLHRVTVNCFSKSRHPRNGAVSLARSAMGQLRKRTVVDALSRLEVKLWSKGAGGIARLDAVSGAHWESRAAFEVTAAVKTFVLDAVEQLESATVPLQAV